MVVNHGRCRRSEGFGGRMRSMPSDATAAVCCCHPLTLKPQVALSLPFSGTRVVAGRSRWLTPARLLKCGRSWAARCCTFVLHLAWSSPCSKLDNSTAKDSHVWTRAPCRPATAPRQPTCKPCSMPQASLQSGRPGKASATRPVAPSREPGAR
jgi:hypothetical protein